MIKRLVLLSLVSLVLVACSNPSRISEFESSFETISSNIKKEYAPDSREKVWEINPTFVGNKVVLRGSTTESEAKEELLKTLENEGVNTIDSIAVLPVANFGDDIYGIVNQSVVNVRYKPDYSSEMATQLLMGTPVRILEQVGYWYRIRTPENYLGWVNTMGITRFNEHAYFAWKSSDRLFVNSYYTLFYESPDDKSPVISDGVWGNIVVNAGQLVDGFCKVKMVDGKVGYVKSFDVVSFDSWMNSASPTPDNVIETARKFTGFPYMWAGTSIKAMDCSGFTKTVFLLNGVVLKRDASQQAKYGEDVDIANGFDKLQKGDLLFFGTKATAISSAKITHVGIFMENNNFIHASSVVRINSLFEGDSNYYENSGRLVAAKRVCGQEDANEGIVSIKNHSWYVNI